MIAFHELTDVPWRSLPGREELPTETLGPTLDPKLTC
jgi:hypothetical protein